MELIFFTNSFTIQIVKRHSMFCMVLFKHFVSVGCSMLSLILNFSHTIVYVVAMNMHQNSKLWLMTLSIYSLNIRSMFDIPYYFKSNRNATDIFEFRIILAHSYEKGNHKSFIHMFATRT